MSTDTLTPNGQAAKRNFVDDFESPDFYQIDDLLTEEHKLIRSSIRDFVKKEITPYVEGWAEQNHFPYEIVKKFGEIGAFGPTVSKTMRCKLDQIPVVGVQSIVPRAGFIDVDPVQVDWRRAPLHLFAVWYL